MPKYLMAGNWKMHKTNQELDEFFKTFCGELNDIKKISKQVDILFAVPFTLLQKANRLAQPQHITIAAQNVHFEKSGAFTGEISVAMLKDLGISAALIGHSERRQYFAETDETVARKVNTCQAEKIFAIVCVGETLTQRQQGLTSDVVTKQVEAFIKYIDDPQYVAIAYEPVWAIGTGLTATNAQAQEVHALIRKLLTTHLGQSVADKLRILYGGSAKPENIDGLLNQNDIDGGLVGGASLKPGDFAAMVKSAYGIAK